MSDFLWASFLYLFQEDYCCPVFLKVPVEMERLLVEKNSRLGARPGSSYLWASATCLYKWGSDYALFLSLLPSLSISLIEKVVATVVSCVLATFQAWAGLWASQPERSQSSPGGTHLSFSLSFHPSYHASIHPSVHPSIHPSSKYLPSRVAVPGLGYTVTAEQNPTGSLPSKTHSPSPSCPHVCLRSLDSIPRSRFLYFTDA